MSRAHRKERRVGIKESQSDETQLNIYAWQSVRFVSHDNGRRYEEKMAISTFLFGLEFSGSSLTPVSGERIS